MMLWSIGGASPVHAAQAGESERVFELRIYYPHPGKLEPMLARFRDHTCAIFARLGAENIGYWVETEPAEGEEPRLCYLLAHRDRETAGEFWKTFMADPEWKRVYAESHRDGPLVAKVESRFLAPTDFSAIR